MKLRTAHPSGWALFDSVAHGDERGWVAELLRIDALRAHAGPITITQENLTRSARNVLRGLHYQVGAPQGKLVRVLQGRLHDVIVDLRRGSPWFGQSFATDLQDCRLLTLWVPPGFAHGFLAREDSLVLYALSSPWEARLDRAIRWDSPALAIDWPLDDGEPIVSQKDRAAPVFAYAEVFEDDDG